MKVNSTIFFFLSFVQETVIWQLPKGGSLVKNQSAMRGLCLIPGSERSPEEGNENPLPFLAWEIPWTTSPVSYSPWCPMDSVTKKPTIQTQPECCTPW